MVQKRSVLIVDRSEETREVLRIALERRGLRILTASRARRGLELARQHRPDLIVLDVESEDPCAQDTYAGFVRVSSGHPTHLVLLGTCRLPADERSGEFVSKPYHYGTLIRRIEQLLGATVQPLARAA